MSLENYFTALIDRVEASDMQNNGTDKNGFFKPTRVVILRHLHLLKDLHKKPNAKPMLQASWKYVVENLPLEWLVISDEDKKELSSILKPSK